LLFYFLNIFEKWNSVSLHTVACRARDNKWNNTIMLVKIFWLTPKLNTYRNRLNTQNLIFTNVASKYTLIEYFLRGLKVFLVAGVPEFKIWHWELLSIINSYQSICKHESVIFKFSHFHLTTKTSISRGWLLRNPLRAVVLSVPSMMEKHRARVF